MEDPVIVTGAPRTGVRLLAAILDGHPALASGPDLTLVAALAEQWRNIESELGLNHARHHGVPPEATRAAFREASLQLLAPRLRSSGKKRFVLQSFSAAVMLEPLAAMFPKARFILMIRDPRDVISSLLQCDWRDVNTGQALPYTRDPVAAAKFSVDFISGAMRAAQALAADGRLAILPYEELCAAPRGTMASLGAFLAVAVPEPHVSPESARLVTESPDNLHPPLRPGDVDSASATRWLQRRSGLGLGAMEMPVRRLCSDLGYRSAPPAGTGTL